MNKLTCGILLLSLLLIGACSEPAKPTTAAATSPNVVRCAVIGGMTDTGLWQALSKRFTQETGIEVEVVSTGPKHVIAEAFCDGQADLITMHASDTIINIAADGYAIDPQPWLKNDLVLIGPPDDPAGVRGMTDAVEALRKIVATKSTFIAHSSLGAQDVLRGLCHAGDITLDPDHTIQRLDNKEHQAVIFAAQQHAYTIVGRIPFLNGKMPNNGGMVLMVQGDVRLRRPYVVEIANPSRFPAANVAGARKLVAFLRSAQTQAFIGQYGKGDLDEYSIFFPVNP